MTMSGTRDYTIASVQRALGIVKIFQSTFYGEKVSFTLMQICGQTGLNPSTATRLLYTLCNEGFLDYNPQRKQYKLSILFFKLGMSVYNSLNLAAIARPSLIELSNSCGLVAFLAMIENEEVMVVDSVFPKNTLGWPQILARSGYLLPMHTSGIAKLYLSQFSDDRIREILGKKVLTRYTKQTIMDIDQLVDEANRCRREGIGYCDCEYEEYIASICAPIYDYDGKIIAGISLGGIREIIYGDKKEYYLKMLLETAKKISSDIGHSVS